MAKREYDENDRICGNCLHHKPSWETGHLTGWHCDNFMADAYGCEVPIDSTNLKEVHSPDELFVDPRYGKGRW